MTRRSRVWPRPPHPTQTGRHDPRLRRPRHLGRRLLDRPEPARGRAVRRHRARSPARLDVRARATSTAPKSTRSSPRAPTIMGRNMFGPIRGEWSGDWRGLVGTRAALSRTRLRPHPPPARAGRDGGRHDLHTSSPTASSPQSRRRARPPATATSRSRAAPTTINQFLAAGLIDVLRLHVVPLTLGFERTHRRRPRSSTACRRCSFASTTVRATPHVTHVTYALR